MKIAAGLVAILLVLLGMITGLYRLDNPSIADAPSGAGQAIDTGPMTGIEKAYLEFAVGHLQTVGDDVARLGVLFSNPALEDEFWRASTTTLLNRIELAHPSMATVEPTPRLRPFHEATVKALEQAAVFAGLLRDMLAADKTKLTDEAAQALYATGDAFEEADMRLGEFLDAHPVPEALK